MHNVSSSLVVACWIMLPPVVSTSFQSLFLCATRCRLTNNPHLPNTSILCHPPPSSWPPVEFKRRGLSSLVPFHTLLAFPRRINTHTASIHPCLCRLQANIFILTLMELKDLQQRAAVFTLYSWVGYFHLNENVWVALRFRYSSLDPRVRVCIPQVSLHRLFVPACRDLIKYCFCVSLLCSGTSAYVTKITCMHLCQRVFVSALCIAYLSSQLNEVVQILSHVKPNFGLSIQK